MKRELIEQFQGKENVTHIISDNGTESYLTQSRSFSDEANAIGASKLNTVENEKKHVLFLFDSDDVEVGRYYLGKALQGKTPSELIELKHRLAFFEAWNPESKSWVPCVGILNNNSIKDVASKAVSFNLMDKKKDIEELMCNKDNIILAVNLAYSAMKYKDPARNEYEVNEYKDSTSRISLAEEIQENLIRHEWQYDFGGIKYSRLKSNGIDYREGFVQNLAEYALRYLFGIVKYRLIGKKLPEYIFGGGDDVFTLNYDENKYESYLEEFVQAQEQCAARYRYLYVFDIKNFFSSVDPSRLKDLYFENDFINSEWYKVMFSKLFEKSGTKGLNPCSEVDFFYANLYLSSLDEKMNTYSEIKYYRYCDDIRIFANDESLSETLTQRITSVLLPLSLELNKEKTRIIDTEKDKIELATACFVWSSRLYFGTYENSILLEGKSIAEIINHDLTTIYIYKLLKGAELNASDYDEDYFIYLKNLVYILKNVHKSATFYRVVLELFFQRGTSLYAPMMFQFVLENVVALLNDETVESFIKYWTLRTFFCTDESYYKRYLTEENKWKGQSWYPKPCYFDQILDILENRYQKDDSNGLMYMISDYIISIIEPSNVDNSHEYNNNLVEIRGTEKATNKDNSLDSQVFEHSAKTMNRSVNMTSHLFLLQQLVNNSLYSFKHPSDKSDLPSFMWNDEGLFMGSDSILPYTIPFLWIRTLAKRNVEKFDEVIDLLNKEFGVEVSEKIDVSEIVHGIRQHGFSDFNPKFDVHANKKLLSTFYGDCLSVINFMLLFGLNIDMNDLLPSQSNKANIQSASLALNNIISEMVDDFKNGKIESN